MRLKTIITIALLAFVAVSVGYLAGQEAGLWPRPGRGEGGAASPGTAGGGLLQPDRVAVYYLHDAKRCETCLRIERMTLDLLRRDFAGAMDSGRLEWRTLVMEDSAALAKRYDAASASVVVAEIRGGREANFIRMDDLWKLMDDSNGFDARVGAAIRQRLPGAAP